MKTGKKRGFSAKALTSELDTFTGEIDERFVCRLACEQVLPGVREWGREKGKI